MINKVNGIMKGRITPKEITELRPNEIFVFGSNTEGKHIGGAAKIAHEEFGASWGFEEGHSGQTYAIPTVDFSIKDFDEHRSLMLERMNFAIQRFIAFAEVNPKMIFLVTPIGCGIAGFKASEVAPMFADCSELKNVKLPVEFWQFI